jgi:hypothetical protein
MVEEEDTFVVVLIGLFLLKLAHFRYRTSLSVDEVESLTAARAGAMAGTEPSDGLRVSLFHLYLNLFVEFIRLGRQCSSHPIG